MEIMFIVFGRDISLVLRIHEISLCKINLHDLHRVITHSLVLVIKLGQFVDIPRHRSPLVDMMDGLYSIPPPPHETLKVHPFL